VQTGKRSFVKRLSTQYEWTALSACKNLSYEEKGKGHPMRLPGPVWRALKAHLGHRLCSSVHSAIDLLWIWQPTLHPCASISSYKAAVLIFMFLVKCFDNNKSLTVSVQMHCNTSCQRTATVMQPSNSLV